MDEYLVKAAPIRLILRLIAQMPFAEDARGVAGVAEHLGNGRCLQAHPLALEDGVGDAVLELVFAGQQRAARRRAGRADVKIGEAHAFVVKAVQVRRLQHGIAVAGEIAITLVIAEDEDDIRRLGRLKTRHGKSPQQQEDGLNWEMAHGVFAS